MRKTFGVILIIIGVLLSILPIKAIISVPESGKQIKSAVTVEDGKISPENEGKLVLVSGTLKAVDQLCDPLTGVKLPGVIADRIVWCYEKSSTNSDGDTIWDWKRRLPYHNEEDNYGINAPILTSTKLIAPTQLGEFKVENKLLMPLVTSTDFEDYNEADLKSGWHLLSGGKESKYCISKSSYLPIKFTGGYLNSDEGKEKVGYNILFTDNTLEYTIIGIQKGDTLTIAENIGPLAYEGILTIEEFSEKNSGGRIGGSIFTLVFGILFLAAGLWMMISGGGRREQQH